MVKRHTKIKVGDTIMVTTGKEKGKTGKVTAIDTTLQRITVDGINVVTRHRKPSQAYPQGGIHKEPRPIALSNVGLPIPSGKKGTSRVGFKLGKGGTKVRILRQASNKEIK